MVFKKELDGFIFVAPSKHSKFAKYDVYDKNGEYIVSFGAINQSTNKPYEQFKDRIGYYKDFDHNDINRRNLYDGRHHKEYNTSGFRNKTSAGFFAKRYLW